MCVGFNRLNISALQKSFRRDSARRKTKVSRTCQTLSFIHVAPDVKEMQIQRASHSKQGMFESHVFNKLLLLQPLCTCGVREHLTCGVRVPFTRSCPLAGSHVYLRGDTVPSLYMLSSMKESSVSGYPVYTKMYKSNV